MRTEDGTIIQKCLDGESEAFGILIDKYKAGIFALVWHRVRNFHDAEEVTQEVFIKAYKHLRTLRRWDSFGVWLYSIAHERCRKWFRSQLRRPDQDLIEDHDVEELKESDDMDSNKDDDMYDSLHEALDSLPEIYQEVLMLHYFGGLTGDEIAKLMCISPSAVRQRLSRARAQLKEEMITMMSETYKEHKLQAGFTFQIVEMIKRIKIQPVSMPRVLPYGISVAIGILITIMSFIPEFNQLIAVGTPTGFPLPVEARVLKTGEIPVDILKISQLPAISSRMKKSKSGDKQNTLLLAPQAEVGTWVRKADMPIGPAFHSIIDLNGKIYVIGGQLDWNLIPIESVYEYDPKVDVWSEKADMLIPRAGLGVCAIDGKIYAVGGTSSGVNFTNILEVYDPITNKWERKADMPTKRVLAVTNQVKGKIYVIGGHNTDGPSIGTLEEYDPKTDKWTKKKDMPTARSFATSCVVNDRIYVFGGCADSLPFKILRTVEVYDPSTDTWTKRSDMPIQNFSLASCVVNGMIYLTILIF